MGWKSHRWKKCKILSLAKVFCSLSQGESVNIMQKLDLSMTKFFKVDPCRMLPKDGFGFGFVLMFFSIGLSLLAKGICLPLLLGDFQHLLSIKNHHVTGVSWTFVWFCSMILPGLLLVSWLFIFLDNQKDQGNLFQNLHRNCISSKMASPIWGLVKSNFESLNNCVQNTQKFQHPNMKIWVFNVSGRPDMSHTWIDLIARIFCYLCWVRVRYFPFKNNSLTILNFLHSNSLFCWKTLVSNGL